MRKHKRKGKEWREKSVFKMDSANHQVRDTEVMTTIDHVIGILESSSKTWTYIQINRKDKFF